MSKVNVIGIGDNVCDKYEGLNMMYPGGQTLNFVVYAKILGYEAAFIGVFGSDACGKHMIKTCNSFNIDISHSRRIDGENAYVVVNLLQGERSFVDSNRGGLLRLNPIKLTDKDLGYIKKFKIVHTSDRSYMEENLESLAKLGAIITFDFSTTWKDNEKTRQICKHINFAFMSCSNLGEFEIKKRMMSTIDWGCDIVIATRGEKGSIFYDGDIFLKAKARALKVLDSLGAGDSFASAFSTCFVENVWENKTLSREEYIEATNICLQKASSMAAKTCANMGAFGKEIGLE